MRPPYAAASARHSTEPGRGGLPWHRILFRLALGGCGAFAWLFVFRSFYVLEQNLPQALARTALLFALAQTIACLATPLAARTLAAGVRRAMSFGVLFAAAAFAVLGSALEGSWGTPYANAAIALFAVMLGLYRAFYWIPYEREAASAPPRRPLAVECLIALAPAAAGLLAASSPPGPLLVLFAAAALGILSLVPLASGSELYERFSWGYRETFRQLHEPENRATVARAVLEGMAGAALILFWPIAIFAIAGWSYATAGAVLSITFLFGILARKTVRRFLSAGSSATNAFLLLSPWLLRIAVATPLGVVLVDSFFYSATPARHSLDPFAFEQRADGGLYLDERTALKEMGLAIGRLAISIGAAVAAVAISFPAALVFALLAAGLAGLANAERG